MDLTLTSSQLLQFPTGISSKPWQELSVAAKTKWYSDFRLNAFPHTVALPFTAPIRDVLNLETAVKDSPTICLGKKKKKKPTQKRILITGVDTALVQE